MPNVFISYSRRDSTQALDLAARLRSEGLSVWMDQTGISGAEKWSAEIVDAIEESQAVLLLISSESNKSRNVMREIALASEQNKNILPVEIESVELDRELKYPLAGLQRLLITNFDAILHALQKLGVTAEVNEAPVKAVAQATAQSDGRKSLLVLPFEDLSPSLDNGWFADGLTGELISALSQVKALRLIDRKTSMECKNFRGHTSQLAKDLDVRYFIEGSVRKFGEQIKISVELLDISSGEHLWADSHRGKMDDIFEIQEEVARKVVEGLELKLTREEEKVLTRRETENADAYELLLRAVEYFNRRELSGFRMAANLLGQAIAIDPNYAEACRLKAFVLAELHRQYDHNPELLVEAEELAKRALALRPDLYRALNSLTAIYLQQKRFAEAEQTAKTAVEHAENDWVSHYGLAFYYTETNRPLKAIRNYEKVLALKPGERFSHWNLTKHYARLGDYSNRAMAAERAIPYFEKRLRLHPDDNHIRAQYAYLLLCCDRIAEVAAVIAPLKLEADIDGATLCDLAEVYDRLQQHEKAVQSLERAVATGLANIHLITKFLERAWVEANPDYSRRLAGLVEKMSGKVLVS